jgi:hypothetical protein
MLGVARSSRTPAVVSEYNSFLGCESWFLDHWRLRGASQLAANRDRWNYQYKSPWIKIYRSNQIILRIHLAIGETGVRTAPGT